MLWGQALASFAAWLLYGAFLARRAPAARSIYSSMSRTRRIALGPLLMVAAGGVLLGGVAAIALFQGIRNDALVGWAWLVVTLMGVVFVHLQSVAALMMISLSAESEPSGTPQTSDARTNGNNVDESQTAARL